jgi:hypothetical protein
MAEGPTILDYIDEFHREASKVMDDATEAAELYQKGEPANAALVIAMSHYKISGVEDMRDNLLKLIKERDGVTPDDALKKVRDNY